MPQNTTDIFVGDYHLLYNGREGYYIETYKHTYYLYELVSLGGSTTSDIIMVMVDDWNRTHNDDDVPTSIGWVYGATNFPNDQYALDDIAEYIATYERTH